MPRIFIIKNNHNWLEEHHEGKEFKRSKTIFCTYINFETNKNNKF